VIAQKSALVHAAHNLIFSVCCLAGPTSLFEAESDVALDIQQHNTPKLFRWLVYAFSFQGIVSKVERLAALAVRYGAAIA
jgi:hypothetical protein